MTDFLPQDVSSSLGQLDLVLRSSRSVPEIPEALNKTVLFGGKRFRPTLCFLMGRILGLETKKMSIFARAAELTHSASLAHDDVLDNAKLRRHRKTLNATTSNARAVLAGDLLLARVMVELSEVGNIQIIHDLALVVEDLVNGEWLQLEARGCLDVSREHLLEVTKRKTASLMSWCCLVAARLAYPGNNKLNEACQMFGMSLGIAFQMVDDVIDFELDNEKDYAKDLKEGLSNFVTFELLKLYPELKDQVQQYMNGASEVPWSELQIETAKEVVRKNSQVFLSQAQMYFETIKEYSKPDDPKVRECIDSIELVIEFLKVRKS